MHLYACIPNERGCQLRWCKSQGCCCSKSKGTSGTVTKGKTAAKGKATVKGKAANRKSAREKAPSQGKATVKANGKGMAMGSNNSD